MNYTYIDYSVFNGVVNVGYQFNLNMLNGTSQVANLILQDLTKYCIQGLFSCPDYTIGEFSCNFNMGCGMLNIMANKQGNSFVYIVQFNNTVKRLNREQVLNYLGELKVHLKKFHSMQDKRLGKIKALIDVDSTLVHFHYACMKRLQDFGVEYKWKNLIDYYGKGDIGADWSVVRQAMRDPVTYEKKYLKDYKGVKEGLALLSQYADLNGYTGAENIYEIYVKRFKYCEEHNLIPNVFLGSKPILQGFDVLFDDNPYIIQKWLKEGYGDKMKIYMIAQSYNVNPPLSGKWRNVTRVNSFYDGVRDFVAHLK